MNKSKLNLGLSKPNYIHVGFNSHKPVLIFLSSKYNLPSIVKKWGDESFIKNGNYDEDTYIVLEVEKPTSNSFQQLFHALYNFVTDEHLLEFYWRLFSINYNKNGVVNSVLRGGPFIAGENTEELARVKSYFENERFFPKGSSLLKISGGAKNDG